jgi:hypothetical protein
MRATDPALKWIVPAAVLMLLLGFLKSDAGRSVGGSIGFTIGYALVPAVFALIAFLVSLYIPNKTAHRIAYVLAFLATVYWYLFSPVTPPVGLPSI